MILVTGGNGFVGKAVVKKLVASGYKVISISRKKYYTADYISEVADITDIEAVENIFKKYEIKKVVHMASLLNTLSRKNPLQAVDINIIGSKNLLEQSIKNNIERFIYGSSYNAIGEVEGDVDVMEDTISMPTEFYGKTKRFVEFMGEDISKTCKFDFVAVRMPVIVGEDSVSNNSQWRADMFQLLNSGGRININFHKDEILPICYVEETANSIFDIITAASINHTIYNLPCENWRVSDLINLLEEMGNNLKVKSGDSKLEGIPKKVKFDRFSNEFKNFEYIPLKKRLIEKKK
jgi:UDP-glucose 4-epimerase